MPATLSDELLPKDGESQCDYAIRFHESLMTEVPNTDERNRLCFDTWRQHNGEEPEVVTARETHDAEQYDEVRDIPVFEEHQTPERATPDGSKFPAEMYDRKALASIATNMNNRISDIRSFSPITAGHTSDDPKSGDPEILGYGGTVRLGMIGNKKPRWALFQDEYHRKDKKASLGDRRGRSVEMWKYQRMQDRFWYPVAALGANAPRLDLPPARYAKDSSEQEVLVERYMMVAPGGNNTAAPSHVDAYGDQPEQNLPQATIRAIMEAIMQSAPMQWVLARMQEDGVTGAVKPMVTQPPEIEGPGQTPTPTPLATPQAQGPPDMADTASAPAAEETDSGTPKADKDKFELAEIIEKQNETIAALQAEIAAEKAHRIGAARYSKLNELSREFMVDVAKECDRTKGMTDEQFDSHCGVIRENYQRRPDMVADYSFALGSGRQNDITPESGAAELERSDVEAIVKYARNHGVGYDVARDKYISTKKAEAAQAG